MAFTHKTPGTKGALAALLSAGLLAAIPAESARIDFDNGGLAQNPGASLTYDGIGGPLVGTMIDFNSIQGVDTPLNAGINLTCVGCQLEFTTGANISENTGSGLWSFAAGGTFVLTGAVAPTGLGTGFAGLPANTVIISGTFTGDPPNIAIGDVGGNAVFAFTGFGTDFKHPDIVAFYYGIPTSTTPAPEFQYRNTEITGVGTVDGNLGFDFHVDNADIRNAMPEPGSALLLLFGLGSLAAYRRRRS